MTGFDNELKRILALAEISLESADEPSYFTEYVVERIEQAYDVTRDPSLHVLRNAVANRRDVLISRAELQDMWHASGNVMSYDKVRDELGDLLGTDSALVELEHTSSLNTGLGAETLEYISPKAEVYASLFNGGYRNDLNKVASAIEAELAGDDIDSNLEVKAFDSRFAIIEGKISFGNKVASVVIPFEIDGGAKFPSVFYGNGFNEFNTKNLKTWASMEGQASANAEMILDHLNEKAGPIEVVASNEDWTPTMNSIPIYLGDSPDTSIQFNMDIPEELAAGVADAAGSDFESIFREAAASCGLGKIALAKSMLSTQLKLAGVVTDKVTFHSEFDGGVILGTHLKTAANKAFIKVPVEFIGSSVAIPSTFQVGNRSIEFNNKNLKSLATSAESGYNAMASSLVNKKFAELHNIVIKCAANSDIVGAEEAMNVILENYGEDHYAATFQDMVSLMSASSTMEQSEFDKYASKLSDSGDEIAHYVSSRVNLGSFGLL